MPELGGYEEELEDLVGPLLGYDPPVLSGYGVDNEAERELEDDRVAVVLDSEDDGEEDELEAGDAVAQAQAALIWASSQLAPAPFGSGLSNISNNWQNSVGSGALDVKAL